MTRADCLEKARECVCGAREEQYGSPEDSFAGVANYWKEYIRQHFNENIEISPSDVGIMMVLLKAARAAGSSGHLDNYVDIAGYAACVCEIESM